MIRTRLSLPVLAALAAIAIAGCGSGSGGDSNADLAGFAPPGSLIFVEGEVRPSGELKAEVDAIASTVAGIDNLGDRVVSELESSARDDGEPFDFEVEVEPWLGERASVAFRELDEDGDPSNPVVAIEATDADAAQEFIDNQAKQGGEYEDVSYEGIDFKVGGRTTTGSASSTTSWSSPKARRASRRRSTPPRGIRSPTKRASATCSPLPPTAASPTSTWTSAR